MIIISLLLLSSLLPHLSFSASVNVDIVNGREAQPHSRPYMVSIQKNSRHICGGFLISDQFVLTAAHCRQNIAILTVVVGAHDLTNANEKSVRIAVSSYEKHPTYKPDPKNAEPGDIMILKLDQKVQLNNNVKTIPIPQGPVEMKVGADCSVAGWGSLKDNGPTSPTLREADVKIKNNTFCATQWGRLYIASEMMCVYGSGGTCEGDSGGPLVCSDIAVGVTGFGADNCNDPSAPNVSVKISVFLQWIRNITGIAN